MLQAYWHLHLQGFCGDSVTLFSCLCVHRWAAEWTSSANRDTYCRAPPIASVCQTSPGPGFSPPVSVSAVHQVFPPVFTWNFSSSSPPASCRCLYTLFTHTLKSPSIHKFSCSLGQCLKVRTHLTFAHSDLMWINITGGEASPRPGSQPGSSSRLCWRSALAHSFSLLVLCRNSFGVVNKYINEDKQAVSPTGNQERETRRNRWVEEEESVC